MAVQTATTGSLEDAQRIIIAEVRYTAEHNAPCKNLVEHFTLGKGEKSITVPFVGKATANALTDGTDMTSSEAIGMTSTSLTTSEVGLKFIVTDKLIRQEVPDVFRMVGRQGGDALARKVDGDIIALFDDFNEATGSTAAITMAFYQACITRLEAGSAGTGEPAPFPYACVLHPHTIYALRNAVAVAAGTYPIPSGYSEDMLKEWHEMTIGGVPIFRDGNIAISSSTTAAKGAMFSKSALCYVESQAPNIERERDASLRATEINFVTDYGVFELKDAYGIEMEYLAATPGVA